VKGASAARFGFHPNLPTEAADHSAANGKANTRPGIFLLIVQPLEYFKDALLVSRGDANAIVPDGNGPFHSIARCGDVDTRRFFAVIFKAVPEEVLEQLN
jgi:hypothetical protein